MEWYIDHPEQIAVQGRASRQLAAEVFDVRLVNEIILKAMCLRDDPLREKSLRRETPLSLAA